VSDEAEQRAREIVEHCRYCGMPDWRPKCRADYEDSVADVAAALREKDAEIEKLKVFAVVAALICLAAYFVVYLLGLSL
jgi:hypothetical protein